MLFSLYIKNRFGSKRGLLNAFSCALKTSLGYYRKYELAATAKPSRFVFICSGNICRSPLAEYVAKQLGVDAISFGLHTRGGDKADERAIAFAKTLDIDLNSHVTQNIRHYTPQAGDLLVGMEPNHAKELEQLFGDRVPITLVGLWLSRRQAYIHDPYNTNAHFFSACEAVVKKAVEQLIQRNA